MHLKGPVRSFVLFHRQKWKIFSETLRGVYYSIITSYASVVLYIIIVLIVSDNIYDTRINILVILTVKTTKYKRK